LIHRPFMPRIIAGIPSARDFGMWIEMRIDARHMSLELSDQVRSIRLGRGANATIDRLDRSSYLGVAIER